MRSNSVNGSFADVFGKNGFDSADKNSFMLSRAKRFGINVNLDQYCIKDANGNIIGLNIDSLEAAIKSAEQNRSAENGQNDTYSFGRNTENLTKDEADKANRYQKEIDEEYKKYSNFFTSEVKNEVNTFVADSLDELEEQYKKFTSVDASKVTIIGGFSEFMGSLATIIRKTETSNEKKENEKATAMSLESEQEIENKQNNIEVYTTTAEDESNFGFEKSLANAMSIFANTKEMEEIAA